MNLRQALQTELWSKRTTRKILVGLAAFIGVVLIVFGIRYEVEVHWLTDGERLAARIALQRIDAFPNVDSISDEEFNTLNDEVDSAVEAAGVAARTSKDQMIAARLIICSMGIGSHRFAMIKQRMIQQGELHQAPNDRELDDPGKRFADTVVQQSCLQLHKELN